MTLKKSYLICFINIKNSLLANKLAILNYNWGDIMIEQIRKLMSEYDYKEHQDGNAVTFFKTINCWCVLIVKYRVSQKELSYTLSLKESSFNEMERDMIDTIAKEVRECHEIVKDLDIIKRVFSK